MGGSCGACARNLLRLNSDCGNRLATDSDSLHTRIVGTTHERDDGPFDDLDVQDRRSESPPPSIRNFRSNGGSIQSEVCLFIEPATPEEECYGSNYDQVQRMYQFL